MKFALSSRQNAEYLNKADEIRVEYQDRNIIYDFNETYPNKVFILEIPFYINTEEVDFKEIATLVKMTNGRVICRISHINHIIPCQDLDIPWYYGMIIDKWEDMAFITKSGAAYVLIGGDLFFNLPKVKEYGVPVRAVPNVADLIPLSAHIELGYDINIIGPWFQPEATSLYEPYIDVIEFENCDLNKERALYRLWSGKGTWPGDLNQIITNLNTSAEGRMIKMEDFYPPRITCGRKCLIGAHPTCQLCFRQFTLANYNKMKEYKDEVVDRE